MHATQLSRALQQFKRVVILELFERTWVEGRLRESHLAEEHLLTFFWIVVVLEHFVEHEVQQLLIRYEKLNEFLTFDLRELFYFLGSTSLHDSKVGLEEVHFASTSLVELIHAGP